jgi:hypothetical protein
VAKVIERVEARYEIQDVEMGKVYKWRPESILVECECGERATLTASEATCEECGAEHKRLVREDLVGMAQKDQALHPWRYARDRQDAGIPF